MNVRYWRKADMSEWLLLTQSGRSGSAISIASSTIPLTRAPSYIYNVSIELLRGNGVGMKRAILLTAFLASGLSALAQDAPPPTIKPAVSGLLDTFKTHKLVGLGDYHGLAQELDFYAALVRDPRFADEVGTLVLEFGALSQPIIDRYLAGEDIPYTELRKVWTDSVGWVPTGTYVGFLNLFAQVRSVNAGLPPQKRIRIWLSDPKIDWTAVKTKADWLPLVRQRDTHAHDLIRREILSKGKKALVIWGGGHFFQDGPMLELGPLLQQSDPGALFIVSPYSGFREASCSVAFEKEAALPIPSLASVLGTSLKAALSRPGCHAAPAGTPPEQEGHWSGADADALLYLGPAATLTLSQKSPDIYMDDAFRAEMSRRYQIIMDRPLTSATSKDNPVSPRFLRP